MALARVTATEWTPFGARPRFPFSHAVVAVAEAGNEAGFRIVPDPDRAITGGVLAGSRGRVHSVVAGRVRRRRHELVGCIRARSVAARRPP